MKIILPWPDPRLSPNAKRRSHWTAYRGPTAKARADAKIATLAALGLRKKPNPKAFLPIKVTFFPPDRRWRDDDGMIGSFKAARDGIADGLGMDDRLFRPHYFFADAEKPGRIEVEIDL